MSIDWFTLTAQVINFLVLVWLLQKFLYGPVTRMMQERQDLIIARERNAQTAREETDKAAAALQTRLRELDHMREQLMAQAGSDVRSWRDEQLRAARDEVDSARKEWYRGLARERQSFARELRRRIVHHVQMLTRILLRELATAELEQQALAMFLRRLNELGPDDQTRIRSALRGDDGSVTVTSAYELSSAQRQQISDAVSTLLFPGVDIRFRVQPDLICGLELHAAGSKVAWSASESLESLEQEFVEILAEADSVPSGMPEAASHGSPAS